MLGNILSPLQMLYNIPAIVVAFTLHEFMHASVADKLGDPTPRLQGRLSLNPIMHIDPIGFLMVILMGFGWAKPVNINSANFTNPKKANILVSVAGPLTNLALAFLFYGFFYFSADLTVMQNPVFVGIYRPFIYINLMLFAFNILPIPPLDGFHVIENVIHYQNYQTIMTLRRYGFIILIVLGFLGVLSRYLGFVYGALMLIFNGLFSLIDKFAGLF